MSFGLGFWAAAGGGPQSFELIATNLITTNTASLTFDVTGLGSTYKHLEIRATSRSTRAANDDSIFMRFNSDTGTNYATHYLYGNGSSVASAAATSSPYMQIYDVTTGASEATGIFGAGVLTLLDPFSSAKNKTVRHFNGRVGSGKEVALSSGAWFSTSTVTSIYLGCAAGSFIAGSRFSLYGIRG